MPDLKDMTYRELETWACALREPRYRAAQLMRWMYGHGKDDPEHMTDIPLAFRRTLASEACISRLEPEEILASSDGTRKFLFRLNDGAYTESVLIPERDHHTLCISTQVGCAMGCVFCNTGAMGMVRNLRSGEIVNQVLAVQRYAGTDGRLTNLVLMGMGEPLANYAQTVRALEIILADYGLGFGWRRVTVSTCGIADRIVQLGHDVNVNLAVSLNAADDETRSRIMPVNRAYPLRVLLDACRSYPLRKGRRITYEYVMLEGVNDSAADAVKLARILDAGKAKINLIPFNPFPSSPFAPPDPDTVERFLAELVRRHFTAIVRKSKGQDIRAACGQLVASRAENP